MKGDLTQLLLKLAARECGVHSSDPALAEYRTTESCQHANRMVEKGMLFKAKLGHKSVRYYTSKARAEKVVRNHELTLRSPAFGKARMNATHGSHNPEAPAHLSGDAVYSPNFKFTLCPSHLPRFQEVELPRIMGGNQRGRVLRAED